METDGRVSARTVTGKDSSEPAGPTTTLSRWSSEPASCSSGGDETAGTDLLERTRRSVATLQHSLAAERDRCRRLEVQLESKTDQTVLTPTTLDAVLRFIEQERSENRQLHSTILRQHKTIAKLRRQLRTRRLRTTTGDSSISSEDVDDIDDNISDFEMVSLDPDCDSCTANNCHRTVHHNAFILYATICYGILYVRKIFPLPELRLGCRTFPPGHFSPDIPPPDSSPTDISPPQFSAGLGHSPLLAVCLRVWSECV